MHRSVRRSQLLLLGLFFVAQYEHNVAVAQSPLTLDRNHKELEGTGLNCPNPPGPGTSNKCMRDAVCPEGLPWANEIHSIVWHNLRGEEDSTPFQDAWSATFVNNVWEDTTKFVLTAKHVASETSPSPNLYYTKWFRLNYRADQCGGITASDYQLVQATYRVMAQGPPGTGAGSANDFSLLEVVSPFPSDANIYYSGWTIDVTSTPVSGALMGHPCSDYLKLTLIDSFTLSNSRWSVHTYSGGVQVGNSGGPLYTQDHLVTGIMTTGPHCSPGDSGATRLSHVWEEGFQSGEYNLRLKGQLGRDTDDLSVLPIAGYDYDLVDLVFTDPATDFGAGFFRTIESITATNLTVEQGGELQLRARQHITITPPFDAQLGSELLVQADEAPPTSTFQNPLLHVGISEAEVSPGEELYPHRISAEPNYPNPFANETRFRLTLPATEHVSITIFNTLGRKVATIMDDDLPAGSANIIWYGQDLAGNPVASGTYFYRIEAGEFVETGSVTIVR